ncbi:DUF5659 domain-containing protein [Peribacillus frigoritolerans]|uniref:DUF5659 domain-containing protein n=1 Tax=Peribacillus frigoritolerans TaxID=450367 RepID=UPI002E1B4451|nr:DUF5659 domain-containing protein [Peribacillus frigoritolerans]
MNSNISNVKDYVVFSQRMAGYLMLNGCRLLKLKVDKNEPTKYVYFFPNTQYVLCHVEKFLAK